MPSEPPQFLRREAYPFSWKELTKQQRSAIQDAARFLLDALRGIEPSSQSLQGSPGFHRRSQLVFIDGDRGMGKTSVLLSLRNIIENGIDDTELPSHVHELHQNRKRFVLLETLDMEPLPTTANLLAAILVRISSRFEYLDRNEYTDGLDYTDQRGSARLALALGDLDGYERLASDLQQLENDAVRAWEGTERQRARYSDPTAYAAEVLASERAGISLNPRLGRVLNGLSQLVSAGQSTNPMFVIPVDDFDLAPTRCLELLRIVRMVSNPRLFFLIAGNTRIAARVLRLQSAGELTSLAGRSFAATITDALKLMTIEFAANNLRKLIPPYQRIRLERLSVGEAMTLRAFPSDPSLEEELEGVTFERNNTPPHRGHLSVKEFLFPEGVPYSGCTWLGGTPRQVLDRIVMFRRLRGEYHGNKGNWGEPLLCEITEDLDREVRENGHLYSEQVDALLEVLDIDTSVRFNFRRAFQVQTEIGLVQTIKSEEFVVECKFPRAYRWLFRSQTENDLGARLSDNVASGLTFLHDLAISLWGGYVVPNSVIYGSAGIFDPVRVDWTKDINQSIFWHLPQWWTLREFERFAALWGRHASDCRGIEDYIRAWLAAELEVLLEKSNDLSRKGRSSPRLQRLLVEVAEERPARFARKYLRESALVEIALLLAPECGCSASLAAELLGEKNEFLSALGDDLEREVRERRARTFANALQGHEIINEATIRLLSAISPEGATQIAWDNLETRLSGFQRSHTDPQSDHLVSEILAGGPTAENLRVNLKVLRDSIAAQVFGLAQPISVMLITKAQHYEDHPINKLLRGRLVPSADESRRTNTHLPERYQR